MILKRGRETVISIHALRGEGDEHGFVKLYNKQKISIHALRGEGDVNNLTFTDVTNISIHALRGEGDIIYFIVKVVRFNDFNPRPPWGGRLHSTPLNKRRGTFQSTPSVGRATEIVQGYRFPNIIISIHALRGEGDIIQSRTV